MSAAAPNPRPAKAGIGAARVERRLAAILAADVAGYSRLMEHDEVGTYARLKRLRTEVVEPALAYRGGRIVDLRGDGGMVEFRSAVAAVEAAVDIQRAMRDHDAELPEDERIRLRIGINLGEVIVDGGAIYGDGVNIAARVECLCEPGGVWLTRAVRNEVEGKLDLGLAPVGPHRVKNLGEVVEVFRVAAFDCAPPLPSLRTPRVRASSLVAVAAVCGTIIALGVGWWDWAGRSLPQQKPTVAILPFVNLGDDATTERLAAGITQDIVTDLTRFHDLDVLASTTMPAAGALDLARDARTGYVLTGAIQRQGERVRVSAQLVDSRGGRTSGPSAGTARPGTSSRSKSRWRSRSPAISVAMAASSRPTGQRRRKSPGSLTPMIATFWASKPSIVMTRAGWVEAADLLRRAIDLDPTLARAWTALSWVRSMSAAAGVPKAAESRQAALDAARRAVELDPADAEGYAALGVALGAWATSSRRSRPSPKLSS